LACSVTRAIIAQEHGLGAFYSVRERGATVEAMGRDDVSRLGKRDAATADAAADLLNRELGDGLYRPEWLLKDAADAAAGVWVAGSPAPVGAAVARIVASANSVYYRAFGPPALDQFAGTVGSLEALAVEPASRRRGIGSRLTSARLDWMRARGCTAVVALSWRSGREGSSIGLFRKIGMAEGPTVERFYLDESLRDGWACPVCGGPCTCSATLFTLSLTP
jgi:ribosomal protein S18 acetylase RimI-like enzyme